MNGQRLYADNMMRMGMRSITEGNRLVKIALDSYENLDKTEICKCGAHLTNASGKAVEFVCRRKEDERP